MDDTQTDQPQPSRGWLASIKDAEKAFSKYHDTVDRIDKLYSSLNDLAEGKSDREFQIFWANLEVMRPSIYQRAPRPVVMPRQSDTGEVVRKASELLERVLEYDVEYDDVHEVLLEVRDDLAIGSRGVPWVLDSGSVMHVDRRDFLHEPVRKWAECGWVARRAYLTRRDGVDRFGDEFLQAKFEHSKADDDNDYAETEEKAQIWEIWSRAQDRVVWVTEGVDVVLDEQPPLMNIKGFYPCPKPAYGTRQRGTLIPVPDLVYYRDQMDEINELTARISSLSESLRLKGFYAAGASEVGEAIETAMKATDNKAILVPVSNLAALGGTSVKDSIVWLPVEEVARVIEQLIGLRRQLIEDVYEITGLSDIMRGVTDAQETLGAQNLKAQFGSIRIREKQNEMIRVALDVLRIKAEIFAERMPVGELQQMAGMQLPTMAQAQQIAMQAQQQGTQPSQMVTAEMVDHLLKDQKLRPFAMEVETDSTIAPNEEAEKKSRIEFLGAVGSFLQQALPVAQEVPQIAPLMAELMKFGVGGFRASRDMGGAIEQFADMMKQQGQGGQSDPAAQAAQQEAQTKAQMAMADFQLKQQELQLRAQEMQAKRAEAAQVARTRQYDAQVNAAVKQHELALKAADLGIKQDEAELKRQQAEIQALLDVEEIKMERQQQRPVAIGNE